MARGKIDFEQLFNSMDSEMKEHIESTPAENVAEKIEIAIKAKENEDNIEEPKKEETIAVEKMEDKVEEVKEINTEKDSLIHTDIDNNASWNIPEPVYEPVEINYETEGEEVISRKEASSSTVNLNSAISDFLTKRAREIGIPIYNYYNILILEYKNNIAVNGITINKEIFDKVRHYKGITTRRQFYVREETNKFIKACAAVHQLNISEMINYIIYLEMDRENQYGKRPSKYSEFNFIINEGVNL